MKRFHIGLVMLVLSSLALAADSASYSLDLNLSPGTQSGSYLCRAEVKDLETGKLLSAPSVTLMAGSPATTKTTSGDLLAELQVSVDQKASKATAELKVSRAGRVVAVQKTSVAIR